MKLSNFKQTNLKRRAAGFSLVELVIVILIIAIVVVLALPQIISSRRLFRFSAIQRQVAASMRDARQEAMSQRSAITFRYENNNKRIVFWGGAYGALNDSRNRVVALVGDGVASDELVYGRPSGAPAAALGDGSNMTALATSAVEIQFQPDGSVIDANNNPQNKAVFFYNSKSPQDTAFAVSVLGAGGRAKIWRYSKGAKAYVE